MTICWNYLFEGLSLKTICSNDVIWKLLVPFMVCRNYLFDRPYLKTTRLIESFWNYLFEWRYLECNCLKDDNWKLLFPVIVFGSYFFQWWCSEAISSNGSISKLLVWRAIIGKYLFQRTYLLLVRMTIFQNTCSNYSMLKQLVWRTIFESYLLQWRYLEITFSIDGM